MGLNLTLLDLSVTLFDKVRKFSSFLSLHENLNLRGSLYFTFSGSLLPAVVGNRVDGGHVPTDSESVGAGGSNQLSVKSGARVILGWLSRDVRALLRAIGSTCTLAGKAKLISFNN